MRCRYVYDEGVKVHIPGCWAAVIHGEGFCDCYAKRSDSEFEETDKQKIRALEKENARLSRIIKKLLKVK